MNNHKKTNTFSEKLSALTDFDTDTVESKAAQVLATIVPKSQFHYVPNHLKYSTLTKEASKQKNNIFKLMGDINYRALHDKTLLADESGRGCFNETLEKVAATIIKKVAGKKVSFIELGPEPIKTELLINRLVNACDLSYSTIDINENSKSVMLEMLEKYLPEERINYILGNFYDKNIQLNDNDAEIRIVTMLGFQEGNEIPKEISNALDHLGNKKPTILISEYQIFDYNNLNKIRDFYLTEEMLAFSNEVMDTYGFQTIKNHEVYLIPLQLNDEIVSACVIAQHLGYYDGKEQYLMTNLNLKPTRAQLKKFREQFSNYKESELISVGDKSVAFQLSVQNFNA